MCRIVEKLCSSGALKGWLESSTETPFFFYCLLWWFFVFFFYYLLWWFFLLIPYIAVPQISAQRSSFFSPDSFSLWNVIKFKYFYSILYVSNSHIRVSIPDLCPMHLFHICGCQTDRTTCFHTDTLQNLFSPSVLHFNERWLCLPRSWILTFLFWPSTCLT